MSDYDQCQACGRRVRGVDDGLCRRCHEMHTIEDMKRGQQQEPAATDAQH